MWKRLKKGVNNWIYEEVEEDDSGNKIPHKERRPLHTKMKYHYPKQAPFRFPVIPDHNKQDSPQEEPAYKRRRALIRQTTHTDSPIHGYNQTSYKKWQKMKELQDVPAYIRKQHDREKQVAEVEDDEPRWLDLANDLSAHTRPEELDAIFKKRDSVNEQLKEDSHVVAIPDDKQLKRQAEHQGDTSAQPFKEESRRKQKRSVNIIQSEQLEREEREMTYQQPEKKYNEQPTHGKSTEDVKEDNDTTVYEEIPYYLLDDPVENDDYEDERWINEQIHLLEQTLKHFKVNAQVVNATQGSSVTRFEVQPEMGVKVSRIRNLADDIKLNLAAKDIRIQAPIPGKHTVGIEVPNKHAQMVGLQEIIESPDFIESTSPLTIALGLTIEGEPLITNIGKMPHGLIAGATGSGKSVCINTILLSLMYKASHHDVKFLLIDPKMVELAPYNGVPHLLSPVITDIKAATAALKWAVNEMEERYKQFAESKVRDITRYNSKVVADSPHEEKMPYIVIVIDELADLMMASPQDVEDSICRIAQKARACGIHLLLATQRPSVDVITGLIKANIPTRISFSVTSQIDSRTIIDTNGADKLLGKGDMLFVENGSSEVVRLQGPFVSDDEIERVTSYVRSIAEPHYLFEQDELLQDLVEDEETDELLEDVIRFVIDHDQASTSLLQRQFRIGYNRAARLIDTLYAKGIISEQNGTKPRDVLISSSQMEELL